MQTSWQTYVVGGAVRDQLLGLPVYDYDHVVVGASPSDLLALGYTQVGKDFPVFLHPQSKQEYALARTERKSGHGYKGFEVYAADDVTLEQDLLRRDLTINAIAQAPDGQLIDPYQGQQDLNERRLRHVSDAFAEDPLRVLRLARFHGHLFHLGFTIDPETKQLAKQIVATGELASLSKERIWQETHKALQSHSPWIYFTTLLELGALDQLAAPLAKLLTRKNNPLAIFQAACKQLNEPAERLAILLHGLNKPQLEILAQQLMLPKHIAQLCLQLSKQQRPLQNYPQLTAEQRFTLLQNCGAIKQPEGLQQLVKLCGILHTQGQMELPELSFSHSLWQQIDADLRSIHRVTAQPFLQQGLQGKALGEALKAAQITALSAP